MKRKQVLAALMGVAAIAFTAGAIAASSVNTKTITDPDVGLSEAQRLAAHAQNTREFWAHYAKWLAEQNSQNIDPRTYPVSEVLASVSNPTPNLTEAIHQAASIVNGTVASVEFRPTADAVVRVRVSETTKGVAQGSIEVVLPNALMPDEQWQNQRIGVVEAMPMIYPGDQVVLFLVPDPNSRGAFDVQPWTGTYVGEGGRVRAVDGNPFAATIEQMTPADFWEAVKAAAS